MKVYGLLLEIVRCPIYISFYIYMFFTYVNVNEIYLILRSLCDVSVRYRIAFATLRQ